MELRLGSEVFYPGDFVLWDDIAPDAAPLVGDSLAAAAAAGGAGLVCTDPGNALRQGVPADRIIVDAGIAPPVAKVEECLSAGHAVLVTLREAAESSAARPSRARRETDPALLAAASVYAWLGVRVFRAGAGDTEPLRQVLAMVASIKGTRPPALSRRGLA
jgi:hypothetical protein